MFEMCLFYLLFAHDTKHCSFCDIIGGCKYTKGIMRPLWDGLLVYCHLLVWEFRQIMGEERVIIENKLGQILLLWSKKLNWGIIFTIVITF